MSDNYLRDLLESVLAGQRTLDEARADLWVYDLERVRAEDVRWWVWCKDHASSYPTEDQARRVRDSIEKLTLDRPGLGCHNTHMIMQSPTDPRPSARTVQWEGMYGTRPGDGLLDDEDYIDGDEGQAFVDAVDPPEDIPPTFEPDYAREIPPEPDDQVDTCYVCGEDISHLYHVTAVRVGAPWRVEFIHPPAEKPSCWAKYLEWRDKLHPIAQPLLHEEPEHGPRFDTCVQCGHNVWTSSVDPTRWWDLLDGHKRYTCHPTDEVAHSQHRVANG